MWETKRLGHRAGFLIHEFQKPARLSFPTHLIPISIVPVGPRAAFGAAWGPRGDYQEA